MPTSAGLLARFKLLTSPEPLSARLSAFPGLSQDSAIRRVAGAAIEICRRVWVRRLFWLGASLLGIVCLLGYLTGAHLPGLLDPTRPLSPGDGPFGYDAWSYYHAHSGADAYGGTATTAGMGPWRYAPIWLPLLSPLQGLSFPVFAYLVAAIEVVSLLYLTRRWFLASFIFMPVFLELYEVNVYLLTAALVVFALRHSENRLVSGLTWPALLFTKVTPFAAVLAFGVARRWRVLVPACLCAAAVLAGGLLADPVTWWAWITSVMNTATAPDYSPLGMSLELRGYLVLGLIWYAGKRHSGAAVLLTVFFALPAIWVHSYAMLIGLPAAYGAWRRPITEIPVNSKRSTS